MKPCLKFFLVVLSFLALSFSHHSEGKTNPKKTQIEKTCLSDSSNFAPQTANVSAFTNVINQVTNDSTVKGKTIFIRDCVFDTIRLVGRGTRYKSKRYYYTDKECFVVELKNVNKKPYPMEWVISLFRKILHL